jgi:hypothetical protein
MTGAEGRAMFKDDGREKESSRPGRKCGMLEEGEVEGENKWAIINSILTKSSLTKSGFILILDLHFKKGVELS